MGLFDSLKDIAKTAGINVYNKAKERDECVQKWRREYSKMTDSQLENEWRKYRSGSLHDEIMFAKSTALKQVCMSRDLLERYEDSNGNSRYRWIG